MDGLVCPRLSGFVKFTQKLMTKVQKKKDDNGKDFCPICGCRSPKRNLCRECFMRSFTPIAYSRNIKVVEQNEFFYGTGKNKRWNRKPDESIQSERYAVENRENIRNYVVSATRCSTYDNSLGSLDVIKDDGMAPGAPRFFDGKTISELFQPAVREAEVNSCRESVASVEMDESEEFVQVELTEEEPEPEPDVLGPLPKLVPDFWEPASEDEGSNKFSDRLKILTNQVVKEAQRPFKEIFGETKSDCGLTSVKDKSHCTGDDDRDSVSSSADSIKGFIRGVQKKLRKQTQAESTQTCLETHLKNVADTEIHDCAVLNKQLRQKATLELLKVAFKTNMILNSLFYYFKKVVESDGSNSESPSDNYQDTETFKGGFTPTDCKISVDSFFFPNRRSAVLWGREDKFDLKIVQSSEESLTGKTTETMPNPQDSRSEVEVLSKSQATLSMLRSHSWINLGQDVQEEVYQPGEEDCNLYMTGYDSEPKYLSQLLTGRVEQQNNLVDCAVGRGSKTRRVLGRVSCSEGNCCKPKITRKFHSEHSTLMVGNQSGDIGQDDGISSKSASSTEDIASSYVDSINATQLFHQSVFSSLVEVSDDFHMVSKVQSDHSQKSLLDLVFGLNRTNARIEPSLLPLPDCQQDLITLSTPGPSKEGLTPNHKRKDAISQTTLSSKHLEQEMSLLHKAFLDQLAHFSVQLVDSCKTFGHSWQTSFLAELVEHFRCACNIISAIIGNSQSLAVPSSDRLDELQIVSNRISVCLARLRAHPHSFIGDCTDHDISTLLSSPPGQETPLVNTWV